MDNIEMNLDLEELENISNAFKRHMQGAFENVTNTITGIKLLSDYWTGPKYNSVVQAWNEMVPRLKDVMMNWDRTSNTIFQEIFQQYQSIMIGNDFVDINLNVDERMYNFIATPIELPETSATYFEKENVEHQKKYEVQAYLENVPCNIKNTYVVFEENLTASTSNALKLYTEKLKESTMQCSQIARDLLKDFFAKLELRQREIEIIEERARAIVNIKN